MPGPGSEACPKPDRLAERVTQKLDRERLARDWRAAIWKRDEGRCQVSGKRVKRTLELDPLRGECHHVYPRGSYPGLRYDVDNGVLLSLEMHLKAQKDPMLLPTVVRERAYAAYRRWALRGKA